MSTTYHNTAKWIRTTIAANNKKPFTKLLRATCVFLSLHHWRIAVKENMENVNAE
jgi:hypothetical protein